MSSLESRLSIVTTYAGGTYASALDILLPDGRHVSLHLRQPQRAVRPAPWAEGCARQERDRTFDLTLERSRNVYHFEPGGRLVSMTDEFGNAVTLIYDASWKVQRISDAAGSGR